MTRQNRRRPRGTNHLQWLVLQTRCLEMQGLRQAGQRCHNLKRAAGFSSSLREAGLCKLTKKSSKSIVMGPVRRMHLQLLKMQWDRYDQRSPPLRLTWHFSIARSTALHRPPMTQKMFSNTMVTVKAESRAKMKSLLTFLRTQKRSWEVVEKPRNRKL